MMLEAKVLNRKTVLATAVAGAAALALAACSGGSGGEQGGGGDPDSADLTVWVLTMDGTQGETFDGFVAAFEDANPGITVTVENRSTDGHKDALRQAAGTTAVPDIYWYWEGSGLGGELVDVGMSHDLTDYFAEYGWEDRFTSAAMAGITQYGGYHGVPFTQQAEGMYYNRTLFEQAGITAEPTTYEELVDAAEKLDAAGITPLEFGGTVNWHVMRLLDSLIETFCGVETADALNTGDGDWGSEACVTQAFTELKTWGDSYLNEGYMAMNNDDSSMLFYSGDAAMALEGTWFNSQVVDNGMDPADIGIFPFPTGTDRLYGFGEAFYISAESPNKDAAAKFLDFITNTENQQASAGVWGAVSVNREVQPDQSNPLNQTWADLQAGSAGIYANNDQNFSTAETTEYWRIQNSVLTGSIDPADAGAEFQAWRDANN